MKLSPTKRIEKESYWQEHLTAYQGFHGTIAAYCRKNGLSIEAFYYWKRKLGTARPCIQNAKIERPFIPVDIIDSRSKSPRLPDPKWLAEFVLRLMDGVEA